nr:immunoglobulin heavy chain junction region [Macaca mulatta]MOW98587.1 immunoglobulin heavy chain junction region [Macaca mulatta]MOW98706.1 immunoglobulin heavy chain junction region [Macaca mulatta]MOW99923.1 immunoglobulin heavy chain junction region [Macaca mulatta]MOX00675.1 immunoglobulin heavy chain junction region [Macaca mulatta]
CARGGQDFDFW